MSTRLSRPCFPSNSIWIFILLLILGLVPALHADQSIILRSGNGVVGGQDAQVHFIGYGVGQDAPPTASTFTAAQSGRFAYIDTPYPTYLTPANFSDPLAQWIGTTPSLGAGSALYAIPFRVTDPIIAAASLSLGYSVDNAVHGVYINGTEISNFVNDGDYHGEYYSMRSDIASLLIPNATNWLYIRTYDSGGFAGLIFSATINTQGTSPGAPTITPNHGGNAGSVSFRIIGSGFEAGTSPGATPAEAGPIVTLTGNGKTITATNVAVAGPNVLTGEFDLTGAAAGILNIRVTNRDGTSTLLNNAFTVLAGGAANLQIQKIGNEAVAGYDESFFITVTNTGVVDSGATSVNELLQPWFTFDSAQPAPTTTATLPDPTSPDPLATYISSLEWKLANVPAGSSANLTYTSKLNAAFPGSSTVIGPACLDNALDDCYDAWSMCVHQVTTSIAGVPTDCPKGLGLLKNIPCAAMIDGCTVGYLTCKVVAKYTCASAAYDAKASKDPNYISGPSGYGPQGWFKPNPPFQYSLSYENEASATKPATNVYLSDTFDPTKFNLSTLSLSGLVIGGVMHPLASIPLINEPFGADIDLRPSQPLLLRVNATLDANSGNVTLSLLSLDPATGQAPTNPVVGFLAPGASQTVLFSTQPISASTTGAVFQNSASVIFDTNAAINTNTWLNTVDLTPPTSLVTALPAVTTNQSLNVAWSGTDLGSGIQAYTIYASADGGPFTPWLTGTTSTSAIYPAVIGHTYGFYSIATDNVGNVEAAKTAAEATTQIEAASPAQIVVTKTLSRDAQNNVVANVTLTNTGGSTALSTLLTLAKIGTVSLTPLPGTPVDIPAGSSSTVTLTFPPSAGRTGAASTLTAGGTYTGGSFNFSSRITLP